MMDVRLFMSFNNRHSRRQEQLNCRDTAPFFPLPCFHIKEI